MHDDLGAGLSRIKFLSQSLRNKSTNDNGIKSGLEKITEFSDEMTEKMGEIVWALNEKNDTLADLVAYIRAHMPLNICPIIRLNAKLILHPICQLHLFPVKYGATSS